MADNTRKVSKSLIVEEDLELGEGTVEQVRGGILRQLTKISFARTYSSISDLPSVTVGRKANVTGYHPSTTVGGGEFVGVASARHDGVIYFDPDRSAEIGTSAYYVDSGVDVPCWERVDVGYITDAMAGREGPSLNDQINSNSDSISNAFEVIKNERMDAQKDIESALSGPSTASKADPAIFNEPAVGDVAPAITDNADQLHRLLNNGNGLLSGQSPSTLGTFAVTRKYDVVAGETYTVSAHGSPLGFQFYQIDTQLIFFDASGEFHSNAGGATTVAFSNRQATFTVPAGASKVAFNVRNVTDYSNTNPMTEAALTSFVNNVMLNIGSDALPFVPYSDGNFTPTSSLFDQPVNGAVTVEKQGTFYYVRAKAQQSSDKDVVWRLLVNNGVNYGKIDSRTGVVDFYGIRFIDSSEVETKAAFNKSTQVHNSGMDESAPIRLNGMFVAAGHGAVGYKANMVAHGKTNVDVGSVWSDGTSQWVLYYIDNTDSLTFIRKYTGTTDKWSISSATFGSATLTHVSGATNTANVAIASSVQAQFVPIIRDYLAEFRGDGVTLTSDVATVCKTAILSETYSLLNLAEQQDYLIANVGSSSPDYTNNSISEQVRFFTEFSWNEYGAMSVRTGTKAKQSFTRTASVDYFGGIQLQRLSLPGDSTPGMSNRVFMYVPDVSTFAGYDFKAVADITTNTTDVLLPATSAEDTTDPASHFCLIGRDATGSVDVTGHLFGYSREVGYGLPSTRKDATAVILRLSTAEKCYPWLIDGKSGDPVVGESVIATAFRAPFLPTDTDLTIPAVIVDMDGEKYCYISAHKSFTRKSVAIPSILDGRKINVLKSSGDVTVHSSYVQNAEIVLTVEGNYCDLVLKL